MKSERRWIAIIAVSAFVAILLSLVGKFVWKAEVNAEYYALIGTIVGAVLGNLDRIFDFFFPDGKQS